MHDISAPESSYRVCFSFIQLLEVLTLPIQKITSIPHLNDCGVETEEVVAQCIKWNSQAYKF